MLGSGQDKWLLQVKTNRGPSRFFFFFFFFFSICKFWGDFSLCVNCSYTYALLQLLRPPTLFGLVNDSEWGIKVEVVLRRHQCFTCAQDQRWNNRFQIHYARYLWHRVYLERGGETRSHITAANPHMHTKWTPRSLLVHSTVDHNKSAGFTQSCCKSCIGLFLLCCVTGSFTCVQFHNHMFVFMTQQCVLWAIITVACKIGAHIIPWHMLCQNSRTRDLAVCERMKIWVL